jgi:3-hydroxyisobutyrate dehydrogenase-like beta-hydroxyacid dehydrogenase
MAQAIAYLGTGLLGAAMAENAAKKGDQVTAWNRSPDKAQALAAFGIRAAATPAEAVKGAQRVHLVLKNDAVVDEVLAQALPALDKGAIVLDHSTTQPSLTAERVKRLTAQGVHYLHCPVFMGPAAARTAQGSILIAGPAALYERVKDELAKMTGKLVYLGERVDLAAVNKLYGNAMIIGMSAMMADVLTLAQASGADLPAAIQLLELFDFNGMIKTRGANMAKGGFTPASFELAMARKDVRLMVETAAGRPLAALPAIAARMDQLIAAGHGAKDASVLGVDAVKP